MSNRREFLASLGSGFGMVALQHLLAQDGYGAAGNPLAPKQPPLPAKAKRVIFLFMEGAPSQMDLFDPKPLLQEWHGKSLPPSLTKDLKLAFIKPTATILGSPRKFQKYGPQGMDLADLLPHTASIAGDLCFVRSMHSDQFNHHPGQLKLFTGHNQVGRPAMGSWVTYGLGSESQNLPGFVVLSSGSGTSGGSDNFSSGFLPTTYAGTPFRSTGDPILYLKNPEGVDAARQRARLDALRDLNEMRQTVTGDEEISSRIHSYELAFRMQSSSPELLDFSGESQATKEMYGIGQEATNAYGTNCLLARRMIERGVRFVMLMHGSWDHHSSINTGLPKQCRTTDQPAAALIRDLKQRGLLEDTLVVWGGEFGRTPMSEFRRPEDASNAGRDHNPNGYTMWMTGGGIQTGQVIGKTDDFGLNILEDKVDINDLQATMLHLLGFDHTKLTYRFMGREFRLTDVHGAVVKKLVG
ncbi:MAG: DUF1501 domain-containing protein [Acidobacteria bacterium]|jgi:hypothetical protein|nr:DUF1501 domain-containing protein [Acidobacteriota bacterium]